MSTPEYKIKLYSEINKSINDVIPLYREQIKRDCARMLCSRDWLLYDSAYITIISSNLVKKINDAGRYLAKSGEETGGYPQCPVVVCDVSGKPVKNQETIIEDYLDDEDLAVYLKAITLG